jgi:hypothetical protein
MTEPGDEIETLRAERDELREALRRRTTMLHGPISAILFKLWASSLPEEMTRTIDDRIAPVRWATGWSPYVKQPPRYASHPSPEEKRARRGLPAGPHPIVELLRGKSQESSDIDDLRAERHALRRAVDHQIIMFQGALSNLYLQWREVDGDPADVAFLYGVFQKARPSVPALLASDGVPGWLDGWFTGTEQQPYVGMRVSEALVAAQSDDVGEIRLVDLPLRTDFPLDYDPHRLNLAVSVDRVLRAGFF